MMCQQKRNHQQQQQQLYHPRCTKESKAKNVGFHNRSEGGKTRCTNLKSTPMPLCRQEMQRSNALAKQELKKIVSGEVSFIPYSNNMDAYYTLCVCVFCSFFFVFCTRKPIRCEERHKYTNYQPTVYTSSRLESSPIFAVAFSSARFDCTSSYSLNIFTFIDVNL